MRPLYRPALIIVALAVPGAVAALALVVSSAMAPAPDWALRSINPPRPVMMSKTPNVTTKSTADAPKEAL